MSTDSNDKPEAKTAPTASSATYAIDEAGVIYRTQGENRSAVAVFSNGQLTITSKANAKFNAAIRRFLLSTGKDVLATTEPVAAQKPATEGEPPQTKQFGERTPEWLEWVKKNDPERHAEICKRLKIGDPVAVASDAPEADEPAE